MHQISKAERICADWFWCVCAVDGSDMLNGDFIKAHLFAPTVVVASVEDKAFVAMVAGA